MRYKLLDIIIDTQTRKVCRVDTDLHLADLSFDVLIRLIQSAPHPVSNLEFANDVWKLGHVSDETLAQRITLLRKNLGDNPKAPKYIKTYRGLGYGIVTPVEALQNHRPPSREQANSSRRGLSIAATMILIVLGAMLIFATHDFESQALTKTVESELKSTNTLLLERARQQLALHQSRETERAISMTREVLADAPQNYSGRLLLSFALTTKATKFGGNDKDKKEAEALARELIEQNPKRSNPWSALAYALSSQGRVDESLSAYQHAYQLDPQNAPAISSAAHLLLLRGELHQALRLEHKAKQAGGKSRYAEIQITQVLEFIDHPAALIWREKAMSLNPGQVVVLSEVARTYLRTGAPEKALGILTQTQGDDLLAPQILLLRARAQFALGNPERARQHLESAGHKGYYELAALNAVLGNSEQAKALIEPAKLAEIEQDPSADMRIQMAEICAALGKEKEALRWITLGVNLGWRDIRWLESSPYLGDLMSSEQGQKISQRITRELDAQRLLIESDPELEGFLSG